MNMVDKMNADISTVEGYLKQMGLHLNAEKTQVILVGSRCNVAKFHSLDGVPQIIVNDTAVPFSETVKNLGLTLNQYLTFDQNTSMVVRKVFVALNRVVHLRNELPLDVKVDIFKSLLMPLFDYCDIIYHGYDLHGTRNDMNRLHRAQNACIRFVHNVPLRESVSRYRNRLNTLTLDRQRQLHVGVFIYKLLAHMLPGYLDAVVQIKTNSRSMSGQNSAVVNKVLTTRDQVSLGHSGSRMWNAIPLSIRNAVNSKSFAARYREHLFREQLCLYNL